MPTCKHWPSYSGQLSKHALTERICLSLMQPTSSTLNWQMHQIWHHLRKATRLSNSVRCSGPTLRSLPSLAWLENLHREQPIKHLNLIPEPPHCQWIWQIGLEIKFNPGGAQHPLKTCLILCQKCGQLWLWLYIDPVACNNRHTPYSHSSPQ